MTFRRLARRCGTTRLTRPPTLIWRGWQGFSKPLKNTHRNVKKQFHLLSLEKQAQQLFDEAAEGRLKEEQNVETRLHKDEFRLGKCCEGLIDVIVDHVSGAEDVDLTLYCLGDEHEDVELEMHLSRI